MNPPITPRHYQTLCGLSLAAIVLMQMQFVDLDPAIKVALHAVLLGTGALALLDRARISPVLMLVTIAAPYLVEQMKATQLPGFGLRSVRFLDVGDMLVCIAALTYFIGHYRLVGLRSGVLPADRRLQHVRSGQSLSVAELASLIFTVPTFALLAQLVNSYLKQQRVLEIEPRINEFVSFTWILLASMFLAAHAFRYWRRLQMDRMSARLLLQDILWHETRGEQRRIQRWLAWKKLRGTKD